MVPFVVILKKREGPPLGRRAFSRRARLAGRVVGGFAMAAWVVSVQVEVLKNLPSAFVDRMGGKRESMALRVQGALNGVSRETAPSTWGARGTARAVAPVDRLHLGRGLLL